MSFAPRPSKPKVRPMHKIPRVSTVPQRSISAGVRKKLNDWDEVEHPTGKQLTKMCWLCKAGCEDYGWTGQSKHLQEPRALNMLTLCAGCSAFVSESKLTNIQIADAVGHRHSDAFITFVREYKVLLELISVEKQRVNIVRSDPNAASQILPKPYHDLATLRKLLTCVDAALSTRGLIPGEKMLLREELGNLQDQVQVHHSGGAKSTPAHIHKVTPRSRSPTPTGGRPRRISVPRPNITHERKEEPLTINESHRDDPNEKLILQLQHEMTRLNASNTDALQRLSTLTEQHKILASEYSNKAHEVDELKMVNQQLSSQELEANEYIAALEDEIRVLKEKHTEPHEHINEEEHVTHDDTTRIIKGLRARVELAESQLSQRPEASREEILMSVDSRRSAIAEAQQLRVANNHIGERLMAVEQQLLSQQQENTSMRQQLRRTSVASDNSSMHNLISQVAPLTAQLNSRLQSTTPVSRIPFGKIESEHDLHSQSTSPVRQRDYAPSPRGRQESRINSPFQRNVVWADAQGNTVSFQMDPNAEREEF